MHWFVYIAKSKTGHYYTGITTNVQKRIGMHNSGEGSQMAREQGPFTIAYVSESYLSKSVARKREAQIKRWTRLKKENLINGIWI